MAETYKQGKEEMSEQHTHCWHHMGQWTDTTGTHQSRKCCHCGAFEQINIAPQPPMDTTAPQRWVQMPKHGPYVSQDVVIW